MGKTKYVKLPEKSSAGEVVIAAAYGASTYRVGHTKIFTISEELALSRARRLSSGTAVEIQMVNSEGTVWKWKLSRTL